MNPYQTRNRVLALAGVWATALAILPSAAAAQQPGRPITIVVPYTPASGPDILARIIGEELQRRWSQPVVVDNKPGASGSIGTQAAARAAPDGHTLLMVPPAFAANVSVLKNVPYDPVKNFAPIVQVAAGGMALAVHPSLPVSTTQEFIAYAKARPGQINYASAGHGTLLHLGMELFKRSANIDLRHVPYKGAAGATQDLVGGHVSTVFIPLNIGLPLARDKQIRLLAVASKQRASAAPELPTLIEQGVPVEVELWFGLLAPAGVPTEIIAKYNKVLNEILRLPQVMEKLAKLELTTVGGTPERFGELVAKEVARWQKVTREAGIVAD